MTRQDVFDYVKKKYKTEPDYPWFDDNAVLRHADNNKWYGLVMEVGRDKLGKSRWLKKLGISTQDLYALIWYFKMKESKKYHLEITVSKSSKTHKFSNFALEFLREKLNELAGNEAEFEKIRMAYKNRNKQEEKANG